MERLTWRDKTGQALYKMDNPQMGIGECERRVLDRLAEYEDEIDNGTLLKAPCKVGDKMWILNDPYFVGEIFVMKVEKIVVRSDEVYLCGYHKEASEYFEARISFAFKTKEEAEKRLEELKNAERKKV